METVELQMKLESYGATPQDGTTMDVEILRHQRSTPTTPGPTRPVPSRDSASAVQRETVKEGPQEINIMDVDVQVVRRDKLILVLIEDVLKPTFSVEALPVNQSR